MHPQASGGDSGHPASPGALGLGSRGCWLVPEACLARVCLSLCPHGQQTASPTGSGAPAPRGRGSSLLRQAVGILPSSGCPVVSPPPRPGCQTPGAALTSAQVQDKDLGPGSVHSATENPLTPRAAYHLHLPRGTVAALSTGPELSSRYSSKRPFFQEDPWLPPSSKELPPLRTHHPRSHLPPHLPAASWLLPQAATPVLRFPLFLLVLGRRG